MIVVLFKLVGPWIKMRLEVNGSGRIKSEKLKKKQLY